jgi:chromosome partitioning protein
LGLNRADGAFNLLTQDLTQSVCIDFVRKLAIPSGRENLYVLPGSEKTERAQQGLYQVHPLYIRDALEAVFFDMDFDYIVLDTMPSKHAAQEQPIWASDYLIIPIKPEQDSIDGLSLMWAQLNGMIKHPTPDMRWKGALLGIMLNEYEENMIASRDTLEVLKNSFKPDLILGPIHRAQAFMQISGLGKTIYEKDPESRAVTEYETIIDRIVAAR